MEKYKMKLTEEEKEILSGKKGEALRKAMECIVRYGDAYGADCLIPVEGPMHTVVSFGGDFTVPYYKILQELIDEGIYLDKPFTADPYPYDLSLPSDEEDRKANTKRWLPQGQLDELYQKLGMTKKNGYTCACYLDESGNKPEFGQILAWSETSACIYANSVVGARTNRMSGVFDMFCAILGKTPRFGFLTDEGRKADWIIEVKTSSLPRPHVLGSVIGTKVIEKVPYIKGLDRYLGTELTNDVKGYLKDMGAAQATSGAVGLYHVENLTPEAKLQGEALIRENARVYVVTDEDLERNVASYPEPKAWKNAGPGAVADKAFIGCPHLTFEQLVGWTEKFEAALKELGREKVCIDTVLLSAPGVIEKFKTTEYYERLMNTGVLLSYICPLMWTTKKPVVTNSSKARLYAGEKYMDDDKLVEYVIKGGDGNA